MNLAGLAVGVVDEPVLVVDRDGADEAGVVGRYQVEVRIVFGDVIHAVGQEDVSITIDRDTTHPENPCVEYRAVRIEFYEGGCVGRLVVVADIKAPLWGHGAGTRHGAGPAPGRSIERAGILYERPVIVR